METELIKDDMIFKPYIFGGWQCIMMTRIGKISVRYGGYGLITEHGKPYEVWYPTEDAPIGSQTADDIWDYIRRNSN
jgi:hypothetical protein